jgi:hypothetical protein
MSGQGMRTRNHLVASLTFLAAAVSVATADDLTDRLEALPGVTVVGEAAAPLPDVRIIRLEITQRVNHFMPWKGTFQQRVVLYHRDASLPMVVATSGYDITPFVLFSEPMNLLGSNQIEIEHRFFGTSVPSPRNWDDLTIFQAATDHHRIIRVLRPLYPDRWISTGVSKGGMATVYHRRFYSQDVDGSLIYSAPNDVIDPIDRHAQFFDRVGNDPACRQALADLQREVLLRRDELISIWLETYPDASFDTFDGGVDQAFELMAIEMPWSFWQFGGQAFCPDIPATTATNDEIFFFLDWYIGAFFYEDAFNGPVAPWFVQAFTQLGYPTYDTGNIRDLLTFPEGDTPQAFLPRELEPRGRHQVLPMIDIDLWVRLQGSELMFIYGENDPWSVEPFHLGPGTRDSYVYVQPGGNHFARITRLPPEAQAAARATLARWAGR